MFVIERRIGEKVTIGQVLLVVKRVQGRRISIGIEAPDSMEISRRKSKKKELPPPARPSELVVEVTG